MKRLSTDLRQRIVDAYEAGEGTVRELAAVFRVAPRSVSRFIKAWRETASVEGKPFAGGPPRKIDSHGEQVVRQLVATNSDATIVELCVLFQKATGISVSDTTMCDTLLELGLPRKKSRSMRANSTVPTLRSSVRSSRSARGL